MRRYEAVTLLAVALLLILAGLVWLFGPYGLIGTGVALAGITLFLVEVQDPDTRARE